MTKPKLIDTHAHLNLSEFENDYKEAVQRAFDNNITVINIGTSKKTSEKAIKIAEEYPNSVFAAVGAHPNEKGEFDYDYFFKLAKNEKVVAIGETGLDYFKIKDDESRIKQKKLFIKHIELASEVKKPFIIHCRDAHEDLFDILNKNRDKFNVRAGVMHFFTGTLEQAKKYIGLDFYISFSGVITFVKDYEEMVRQIPLEKILVETDCPFAAPVPYRGKRNEPAYVKYVAQKIAEIKGLSFNDVAERTTQNAKGLFKI